LANLKAITMNLPRDITELFTSRDTTVLLLVVTLLIDTGCANPRAAEMQRVQPELDAPLTITKLPLRVKLEVDEKTRNLVVEEGPSGFWAGPAVSLPIGEQLLVGAKEASQLLFKSVQSRESNYDAILKIHLPNFQFEWKVEASMDWFSSWITYSMNMVVETELVKNDGSIIYKKLLKLDNSGAGKTELDTMIQNAAPPVMKGANLLVGLWIKKLAQDITQDSKVLQFAKEVGGSSTTRVAEVPGPTITVTSRNSTDQLEVQLSGSISSDNPITSIGTSINGRPLDVTTRIPSGSTSISLNQQIPLTLGENVISITATNKAGGTSQEVITVVRTELSMVTTISSSSKVGERWAVVVGISEYKHTVKGIPNLKKADDDAKAFAEFIKSEQGGGFKNENVLLLVNERATSNALRHALFTFLNRAIEEDLVYFFFSGQGAPEPDNKENYYLLTHNADPDNLPTTALATWDVDAAFKRNIKAKRTVLFVDASHVSAIGKDATDTRGITVTTNRINKYLHQLSGSGEGMAIFTASKEGQLTMDTKGRKKTGLFTHYLMEALSGDGDANNDGTVTLGEAIDYTIDLVSAVTRGKQRPDIAGKFDRNLPLAVIK